MALELSKKEASLSVRTQETRAMEQRIQRTVLVLQKKHAGLVKARAACEARMLECQRREKELMEWQEHLERLATRQQE